MFYVFKILLEHIQSVFEINEATTPGISSGVVQW